ncbi:MAG: hypothetical protein ACO39C_07075, partial [Chthoniobacterales bacterium]
MKKSKKSDAKKPKAKAKPAAAKSKTATKRRTTKKVAEDVHKFEATKPTRARKPAARTRAKKSTGADIDNLGDLPRSYGEENI